VTGLVSASVVLAVGGWQGALVGLSMTAFGVILVYVGLFTDVVDDLAKQRKNIGLPENRTGQTFAAVAGGSLFAIFGVLSIVASFFEDGIRLP